MTLYVIKRKPPSHDEYKTRVIMGYLGSYDRYAATVNHSAIETVFVHGDLAKHCTESPAPRDNLCAYPVGDGESCDRLLCEEHSHEVEQIGRASFRERVCGYV